MSVPSTRLRRKPVWAMLSLLMLLAVLGIGISVSVAFAGAPAGLRPGTISAVQAVNATGKGVPQPQGPGSSTSISPAAPASPNVVLYDQFNNPGTNSTLSQQFGDLTAASSQTADDFNVPTAQNWQVSEVDVAGVYFNGSGPATSFNVYFYHSVVSGTYAIPGAPVYTATNQLFSNTVTNTFAITLTTPATLVGSTTNYFVSVVANMNFASGGEWGWTDRTVQSHSLASWRNPGGYFGGACNNWDRRTFCVGDAAAPDQMFRLVGTSYTGPTFTPTNTLTPTSTATATATPCVAPPINENFDTGTLGVFTSTVGTCTPGGCGWNAVASPTPHSAPDSAFAPDLNNISDQYLSTAMTYTIPSAVTGATLSFWHDYNLERTYDGGVLEFSTDAGTTWHDVLTFSGNSFTQNGYVATISSSFGSPIAGRQAWTGNSNGYVQTIVNLQGLVGQTFKMRFREANDNSASAVGWNVDDVVLSYSGGCAPPTVTATPTQCVMNFSDVQPSDYFYNDVHCVYCLGAVSGYADGTFRPFNNTTRGQMTKIIVIALQIPISTPTGTATPTFNDVPPGSTFYPWIETSAANNIVSGYNCGGPGEPCPGFYFRPNNNVTRGQLSKIVVVAASQVFHWDILNPTTPTFTDVAPGSPFYTYIETAYCHGVISGYGDHTFRPGNDAIRAQIAKIVCNTSQNPASTCPAPPTSTATTVSATATSTSTATVTR